MFASSREAEDAFYEAFSAGDVDAMMRVWADGAELVCIHPSGQRLEGRLAIQRSWVLIFDGAMPRNFVLRGRIVLGSGDTRIHLLEEHITVPGTRFVAPPVLATNIYVQQRDGWRMVVHHASAAPGPLGAAEPPAVPPAPTNLH